MEKLVGRAGKVQKSKKKATAANRELRKLKNYIFPGLKRHRKARDDNGVRDPHKITSGRLTIRRGIFENALRSDCAAKDLNEESKALLNEDWFKIIELGSKSRSKYVGNPGLTDFREARQVLPAFSPTIINQIDQKTDQSQSLFCDIEQNYNKHLLNNHFPSDLNDNYLIDKHDLKAIIEQKLNTEFLTSTSIRFKQFGARLKTDDYNKLLANQIVTEQKSLNTLSVLNDLSHKFQNVPVADNCLKRKFTRAYNNLVDIQAMGSQKITNSDALGLIKDATLKPGEETVTHMETAIIERCTTPENMPITFPDESYHTPENQKYVCKLPGSSKLQTGIYVVPQNYMSSIRDMGRCEVPGLEPRPFLYELNDNERQNEALMANLGVSRLEQCKLLDFEPNATGYEEVQQRPKKMSKQDTRQQSFGSSYFGGFEAGASPEEARSESRRKLNYSSHALFGADTDSEAVGRPQPQRGFGGCARPPKSPVHYIRLSQGRSSSGKRRPKYSPNEYSLRKRFAPHTLTAAESGDEQPLDDNTDMPQAATTPTIKYLPRLHK